jgi:hypothetical protein
LALLSALVAAARQTETVGPTNAPPLIDALPLTNAVFETQDTTPSNEVYGVEEFLGTNGVGEASEPSEANAGAPGSDLAQNRGRPGAKGRTYDGRQSRRNRFAREQERRGSSPAESRAGTDSSTNGPGKLDYDAFRVIVRLNIFDPNRQPGRLPRQAAPIRSEYFTLVGTMSYEKGTFAFFSGSDSRYEKALRLSDSIAGYKITNIDLAAESVKLASGTNGFELRMGMQMRREQEGEWQPAAAPASLAASSSSESTTTTTTDAAASGSESETIKRMMQRREKE